jgi:hypothetical protein
MMVSVLENFSLVPSARQQECERWLEINTLYSWDMYHNVIYYIHSLIRFKIAARFFAKRYHDVTMGYEHIYS